MAQRHGWAKEMFEDIVSGELSVEVAIGLHLFKEDSRHLLKSVGEIKVDKVLMNQFAQSHQQYALQDEGEYDDSAALLQQDNSVITNS
jgi:hypothetical protein